MVKTNKSIAWGNIVLKNIPYSQQETEATETLLTEVFKNIFM